MEAAIENGESGNGQCSQKELFSTTDFGGGMARDIKELFCRAAVFKEALLKLEIEIDNHFADIVKSNKDGKEWKSKK